MIVKEAKLQEELIGGLLDKSNLKISFLNNGRFCPPSEFLPDLPNAVFGEFGYLDILDLWIGIPDGPWAPKVWDVDSQKYVSAGPTVSGTIFEPWVTGTDWSTINATRGVLYTGELLYSDVYPPTRLFDFILAPTSEFEQTWPKDPFTGFRQWPGRWKNDPLTGKPVTGSFLGDQDIFISYDDKTLSDQYYPEQPFTREDGEKFYPQRGYPIGAEVLAQIVGFQEGSISNMVIFDMQIINKSNWDYNSVYFGVYYKTRGTSLKNGFTKNEYNTELNDIFPYNLSYSYKHSGSISDIKCFGVQLLRTPLAEDDQIDNDGDGFVDEAEGEELGLTGWHFFHEDNFDLFSTRERLQNQVLAGDTSGLSRLIDYSCFFPDSNGQLDPNFDSPDRIRRYRWDDYPGAYNRRGKVYDASNLLSCGPIDWASGDTLNFIFAILVADSLDRLKASAQLARKIIDRNYHYSGSPPPPNVTAVPQNGKVTLYWDRSAETVRDPLTDYMDFEGYRIYRTNSDPVNNDWGQRNYDDKGEFVNFIPIARCDLVNGVKGFESIYPHRYLGDDTGLFHTWTDTTVTNGVTYWYSVCSYDRGILPDEKFNPVHYPTSPMKECSKGTDPGKDINLVKVIPGSMASNMNIPTVQIEPLAESSGNGPIEAIIFDPYAITDHNYRITFEDTTFGFSVYDLYDETEDKLLFEKVSQTNGEEGIIFDGLQLTVQRYDNLDILGEKSYWYKLDTGEPSNCTWKISGGKLTTDPYPFEYEIRFIDGLETGVMTGKTAPYQIWNTVLNQKCAWDIYYNSRADTTDSLKNTWSSGDIIYIWDEFDQTKQFTLRITISKYSYFTYEREVNIPPQPGDVAHIVLKRPFLTGDQFRIKTKGMKAEKMSRSELNEIKVVPNPYIVEAGWELNRNESKIQFINLPSECKIHIFSMAGDKVRTLHHNDPTRDYEFWDLLNNSNLKVSYGLYVFVVEAVDGKSTKGKFVILR